MRVVQYTQTATIRQRQLANRSTGSRFAVNVSRYTGNLINHLSFDGNVYRKLICKTRRKYFASNCPGLLKMFSSQTQSKSTCLTRSRFARHLEYSASSYQIGVQDVVKSTRFDRLVPVKVACYTGSQFGRHLESIPRVTTNGGWRCCRIDSIRLVTVDVDLCKRKSICKTIRKFSASGHELGLKILSNRTTRHSWCRIVIPEVDWQDTSKILRKRPRKGGCRFCRIERLVTVDVDPSYRKSICKTTLLMTSRVDPCESSRFVYIEYLNLTLMYYLLLRIDFPSDGSILLMTSRVNPYESCQFVNI